MSTWKMQKFLSDLVHDMRSRNLLPLALVLLVAMIAAPVLIVGGSSDSGPSTPASAPQAGPPPETMSAVVSYEPGLRDYKQRLDELDPKNPFRQQFAPSATDVLAEDTSAVPSGDLGGSGGTSNIVSGDPGDISPDGGGSGSGGSGGKGGKTTTQTRYVFYETDVLVGESGGALERRNRVQLFTYLPSADAPAAVYLGLADGATQAIFLVSEDVTSISGAGVCFPDPDRCQLLGLRTGQSADLVLGGRTWRLEVARIQRRTSSKPPR